MKVFAWDMQGAELDVAGGGLFTPPRRAVVALIRHSETVRTVGGWASCYADAR